MPPLRYPWTHAFDPGEHFTKITVYHQPEAMGAQEIANICYWRLNRPTPFAL